MLTATVDGARYLGIDIGGTKCAAIIGDQSGDVLARVERPTKDGLAAWPEAGDNLLALIKEALGDAKLSADSFTAVGISCGGPLSSRTGRIMRPPNLPGWDDIPIRDFLYEQLAGLPVFVENDANATALAEHRWGAGKGSRSLAYLTCGTGIGAGIILGGQLYRGKNDLAGEIGHAVIIPEGPLCLCGKRGCLEALASGSAIGRIGAEFFGIAEMSGKDVIDRAGRGDADARRIVLDAGYYLGLGIANLFQTLDLDRVVLGSLAVYAGEEYFEKVRSTVAINTWKAVLDGADIVRSGLGTRTQDLAALVVAMAD